MVTKKVAVLILSYNGKHLLDECLSTYLNNDYPEFKVFVIDNGSVDGTAEFIKINYPSVDVIRTEKNLGYSGGFNFGLKYVFERFNPDYVIISNNDVKVDCKLISSLVSCANKYSDVGFVNGKIYYFDEPNKFQYIGKKLDDRYWRGDYIGQNEFDIGQYEEEMELAWTDDVCWLITRELYNKTHGYDEEFRFQAEDFDWQARGKKLGFKIYYCPAAKLWHKVSATIGVTSPLKSYYDARNPLIVHLKHRKFRDTLPFVKKQFISFCLQTLVYTKRLKFKNIFALWAGFLSSILWFIKYKIKT